MASIDYINKQGLSTALEKLRSLCMTIEDGEAIYNMIDLLAAAVVYPTISITIPVSGWVSGGAGEYNFYIDIAAGITSVDSVDVVLSPVGLTAAKSCGLCPTVETLDGALRFRAVSLPLLEMPGEYRIIRGAVKEEGA